MKIHQIPQNSPEWLELRKGKLTASKAQAIATAGKGLETLCYEIIAAKYSSAEYINYTNDDIERGHLLEEQAREMYELETGNKIELIGFIEADEQSGASPDGLIGEDGLIEIKCPNDKNYLKNVILGENGIDSGYIWQMQMQMYITNRKYCIFLSYNPNFTLSLFYVKIKRDEDKIKKIKIGIEQGKKILTSLENEWNAREKTFGKGESKNEKG